MSERRNWWKVIERAIQARHDEGLTDVFTHEEIDAAGEWPTCAVGQLCRSLPRWTVRDEEKADEAHEAAMMGDFSSSYLTENDTEVLAGAPKDAKNFELGIQFTRAVEGQDPFRAFYLMSKIENRTAELLARAAAKKTRKVARKGK